MRTITCEKVGYGYLAATHNDGRAVFCKTLAEAKQYEGTDGGELLGIKEGYVIEINSPHGGDYGLYCSCVSYQDAVDFLNGIEEYDESDEDAVFYVLDSDETKSVVYLNPDENLNY